MLYERFNISTRCSSSMTSNYGRFIVSLAEKQYTVRVGVESYIIRSIQLLLFFIETTQNMSIIQQEAAHIRSVEPEIELSNIASPYATNIDTESATRNSVETNEQTPATPPLMTLKYPSRNLWRVASVSFWAACGGFSDAAPGALLPSMEAYYKIGYATVSLIWMSNAVGFILVACFSHKITPWFGKRGSLTYGIFLSVVAYACIASGGPFPLICVGFFFAGIGLATVLAQSNVFLTKLDKQSKYLALFHACYGAGATIAPLGATSMVKNGTKWHFFYLILLAMMVINSVTVNYAFKGADEDLLPWDHVEHRQEESSNQSGQSIMVLALKNTPTWLIALFVFCYEGSEVALGGWIVTYLLDYRGAGQSYGYVLSGFWAGLTLGRLLLTRPLHKSIGVRKSVFLLAIFAIAMVVVSWVVPNSIAVGVFVGFAGLFIGPTYPLMITAVSFMVPRKIEVVSLTIMTAFGLSGGAIFPFVTGLIAEKLGAYVVLPIFIASYSVMLVFWLLLPNIDRKSGSTIESTWKKLWSGLRSRASQFLKFV